ncbi:MAG TPA: phosphoribosyl-AMP cyclohydrolase, partial [Desulfobacteria bacterium]|nr:phosphoribosyl-AMP cyclohydrolase [Desulfobacteria bacterium]
MKGVFTVENTQVIEQLKFDDKGLIPAVVQDAKTGQVLMLAYMNKEALQKTLTEGKACYFSRSRGKLWVKGETSGHYQYVQKIAYDCDADSILLQVEQAGVACHEDFYTCFHNTVGEDGSAKVEGEPNKIPPHNLGRVLDELYALVKERKASLPEGSYTTY